MAAQRLPSQCRLCGWPPRHDGSRCCYFRPSRKGDILHNPSILKCTRQGCEAPYVARSVAHDHSCHFDGWENEALDDAYSCTPAILKSPPFRDRVSDVKAKAGYRYSDRYIVKANGEIHAVHGEQTGSTAHMRERNRWSESAHAIPCLQNGETPDQHWDHEEEAKLGPRRIKNRDCDLGGHIVSHWGDYNDLASLAERITDQDAVTAYDPNRDDD